MLQEESTKFFGLYLTQNGTIQCIAYDFIDTRQVVYRNNSVRLSVCLSVTLSSHSQEFS